MFGAANAGKSSLLQGLVRKHGQPGSNKSEPKEEEGNAGQAPAANIAVNEISVARGNRQREGLKQAPPDWQLAGHADAAAIALIDAPHVSLIAQSVCRHSGFLVFATAQSLCSCI